MEKNLSFLQFLLLRPVLVNHEGGEPTDTLNAIKTLENALLFAGWSKEQARIDAYLGRIRAIQPTAIEQAKLKRRTEQMLRYEGHSRKEAVRLTHDMFKQKDEVMQ